MKVRLLAVVLGCLLVSSVAIGASLSLRSERDAVQVGETFEVEFEVSRDANEALDRVQAPDFSKGFSVIGSPSTSSGYKIQMGMGPTLNVHTQTNTYALRARAPGVHTIGPATARLSGALIRSNILTIRVGQAPGGGGAPGADTGGVDAPLFDRQLFMRTAASKTDAFVGEAIIVEWQLFINVTTGISEQPSFPQMPVAADFFVEELRVPPDKASSQRVVEGNRFNVHVLKRQILVPLKPGALTIGAMSVDTAISLGFFRAKKISRSSRPLTITVKPLPADGRPPGFVDANVGKLKFDAEWRDQALKVAANTPLVLRVTLTGDGAARQIEIPTPPQSTSYRVFPKVVEDNAATRDSIGFRKVIDLSIVPTHGGLVALPSMTFHWFDPEARRYQSVTTPPRTIEVEGALGSAPPPPAAPTAIPPANPAGAPRAAHSAPAPAAPMVDPANFLRPIRTDPVAAEGQPLFASSGTLLGVTAVPPALYFIAAIVFAVRRRQVSRGQIVLQRGAARKAQRSLEQLARDGLPATDACNSVVRIIYKFLQERAAVVATAMTRDELAGMLKALGASDERAAEISRVIEFCESARYSPAGVSADDVARVVVQAKSAIDRLARELKPS